MMLHDPTVGGPKDPVAPAIPRALRSIRRTTTIDTNRPEGMLGPPVIDARARDLWTPAVGPAMVVGEASVAAHLDGPRHHLVDLRTTPDVPALAPLIGAVVGPGFRARVDAAVPGMAGTGSPLSLLLDDLPGATLVSGYSMLHAGIIGTVIHDEYLDARGDLCAGWAVDGSMMGLIREHGVNPTPLGPEAPPYTRDDDPLAWHPITPLAPLGMRRMRRIDVAHPASPGEPVPVDVFFRDTHVDADGRETIVHEYSVTALVGATGAASTRTVLAIEARADVLPWQECPQALASASRVVGRPLAELRPWVRATFKGTTTCTHLNDVLRGLADVDHLIDRLVQLVGGLPSRS